jgi:HlyD family secretion protein
MRAKRYWKGGALGLAVLVVLAFAVWPRVAGRRVGVHHAERRELVQTVVTTGRVLPPAEVKLAALASGNVTEVTTEVGDQVKRGAPLVRLDEREARAALSQAKAALARAHAQRKQVSVVSASVLEQSVARAKARLDDAKRRHADNQRLAASGAIAKAELDRSSTELAVAESDYAAAKASAAAAAPGGAESATAAASIAQAQAEVRAAEVRLERMTISAPVDGVVLERDVEPGDTVQPGVNLLLVAATGEKEIRIEPDEKNLALIAIGQPAVASAEAFPDRRFGAKVSFIAPAVDPTRGTIEVRLGILDAPSYLRPAMTLSVEIEVARKDDALVIDGSLIHDLATDAPWVMVARDGRAERVDVRVGIKGDERVEIVSGIDVATEVISPAERKVSIGERVRRGGP